MCYYLWILIAQAVHIKAIVEMSTNQYIEVFCCCGDPSFFPTGAFKALNISGMTGTPTLTIDIVAID